MAPDRSDAREESFGVLLLRSVRSAFDVAEADRLPSARLAEALADLGERRSLNARGLARQLRPFGIAPRTIRIGGTTIKGYHRGDFEDAWARHLANGSEPSLSTVTVAEGETVTLQAESAPSPSNVNGREETNRARDQHRYGVTVPELSPHEGASLEQMVHRLQLEKATSLIGREFMAEVDEELAD
jgi:hypothetical protein